MHTHKHTRTHTLLLTLTLDSGPFNIIMHSCIHVHVHVCCQLPPSYNANCKQRVCMVVLKFQGYDINEFIIVITTTSLAPGQDNSMCLCTNSTKSTQLLSSSQNIPIQYATLPLDTKTLCVCVCVCVCVCHYLRHKNCVCVCVGR